MVNEQEILELAECDELSEALANTLSLDRLAFLSREFPETEDDEVIYES